MATRRDAVASAEVRSLHADSGTDQGRLAQALTSGACVASSRDPTGKWFCRNLCLMLEKYFKGAEHRASLAVGCIESEMHSSVTRL